MEDPPSNQRGRGPQRSRRRQPRDSSRSRSRPLPKYVPSLQDNGSRCNQACWYWMQMNDARGTSYRKILYFYENIISAEKLKRHRPICPGREASPARSSPSPNMSPKARPQPPPPPPAARPASSAWPSRPSTLLPTAKSAGNRTRAQSNDPLVNRVAFLRNNPSKAGSVAPPMRPPMRPPPSPVMSVMPPVLVLPGAAARREAALATDEAAPATDDHEGRYPLWARNVQSILAQLGEDISLATPITIFEEQHDQQDKCELA